MIRVTAIAIGSGTNGVIHVGFRDWISKLAVAHDCSCVAINIGDTVQFTLTGDSLRVRVVLAKARFGPPGSRVLELAYDKEEYIQCL